MAHHQLPTGMSDTDRLKAEIEISRAPDLYGEKVSEGDIRNINHHENEINKLQDIN